MTLSDAYAILTKIQIIPGSSLPLPFPPSPVSSFPVHPFPSLRSRSPLFQLGGICGGPPVEIDSGAFYSPNLTFNGDYFNDFPDNQLPKFCEVIFKDTQFGAQITFNDAKFV